MKMLKAFLYDFPVQSCLGGEKRGVWRRGMGRGRMGRRGMGRGRMV